MQTKSIEQIIATHKPEWQKWPDTDDLDYGPVLAIREKRRHVDEATQRAIEVTTRYLPVFHPQFWQEERPYRYPPHLDNRAPPTHRVTDRMLLELTRLRSECSVLLWYHGYGCYPAVADQMKSMFPLVVLLFADDAPGSSEAKTLPVAHGFHSYGHWMKIYDFESGRRVSQLYREKGVDRTYFLGGAGMSHGLVPWLDERAAESQKIFAGTLIDDMPKQTFREWHRSRRILNRDLPIDLVFVGGIVGCEFRRKLLRDLNDVVLLNRAPDLKIRLYGQGMERGMLLPRQPPEGDGPRIGALYEECLFGVNPQVSSLYNLRLIDLWECGVVQICHDPHGELLEHGFEAGEHYLSFDGTVEHLLEVVRREKQEPHRLVQLVERARKKASEFVVNQNRMLDQIYLDAWDSL